MGGGAGGVAALGMGRGLFKNIKRDDAIFRDLQEQQVADAYREGYESAKSQFVVTLEHTVKEALDHLKNDFPDAFMITVREEPCGYDFVTGKPTGAIKTVRMREARISINITPKNEFFNIIKLDPSAIGLVDNK